jgi:peptide/nickel transport system permease protein
MGRFVARRLAGMVFVLLAVSMLTFAIFNVIPNGAPEDRIGGRNSTATQREAIRQEWDFDKPVPVQYVRTMEKVLSGDVISYANQTNVMDEVRRGLPRTISLAVGAALLWFVAGVALGLFSAVRAGRLPARLVTVVALIGVSVPVFWLGAIASYYLGFKAGILPNGGYATIGGDGLWAWFQHLILPWCVLAVLYIGIYSRVLRATVLDTIDDDYVRTARAKGLTERRVLTHHVLRTSMIPVVTLWGLDFGAVLGGGAILTETVFDLQGVGQYYADSVAQLDVPPVLVITLLGALVIVVLNTIVDIVYALLDPRIRL